jgi:hypothetical protein
MVRVRAPRQSSDCECPFRPAIRSHEAPHEAKAVALAEVGLHKANTIIADRENGTGCLNHANCANASRQRMNICVRDNLGDDGAVTESRSSSRGSASSSQVSVMSPPSALNLCDLLLIWALFHGYK